MIILLLYGNACCIRERVPTNVVFLLFTIPFLPLLLLHLHKNLTTDAFAASPGEAPATLDGAAAPPTPVPVAAALDACSGNGGFHVCYLSSVGMLCIYFFISSWLVFRPFLFFCSLYTMWQFTTSVY